MNPGEITLHNSDKVRVSVMKENFKVLQEHDVHGGWNDGMEQVKDRGVILRDLFTCLTAGSFINLIYKNIVDYFLLDNARQEYKGVVISVGGH